MKKSDHEIETVKEVKPMRMFCFKSGLDQLPHLVSEESASSSHRSDLWVEKIYYPEKNNLSFRTSYYNSLLVEQSMILNRRSDDGKKSRKFDFKTKHFRWYWLGVEQKSRNKKVIIMILAADFFISETMNRILFPPLTQ